MVALTVTAGIKELVRGAIAESTVQVELEEGAGEFGPGRVLAETKVRSNSGEGSTVDSIVLEEAGVCLISEE